MANTVPEWIEASPYIVNRSDVGDAVFVVERAHGYGALSVFELRLGPERGNRSRSQMLSGWCGSLNGVDAHAHGVARIREIGPRGVRIERLSDGSPECQAALNELGYPGLEVTQPRFTERTETGPNRGVGLAP